MRGLFLVIISVLLSVVATALFLKSQDTGGATIAKESAYERVLASGTIRCGYGVGAPYVEMDPNTKKMKGFAVDVMEAIGRNLNLKVEWTEESGWGGVVPSLNEGRIDVGCSSLWMAAPTAREALFSDIYLYSSMYFYVRMDDDRFESLDDLKTKNAKLAFVEGDNTQVAFTKRLYPDNPYAPYAKESQSGTIFLDVAAGKADAVLNDPGTIAIYNEKAAIKLRTLSPDKPVATIGVAFPVAKNEVMLKNMMDSALREMQASGEMAQIMKPYQIAHPGAYYLPVQPYAITAP